MKCEKHGNELLMCSECASTLIKEIRRDAIKEVTWFFNKYQYLTRKEKGEVCCSFENKGIIQPYSWSVAWLEIIANTKLGEKFLKILYDKRGLEDEE